MKTAVDISDGLPREAHEFAAREGITLRTMGQYELYHVLAETKRGAPFRLHRNSFKGRGRQAELADPSWDTLRDLTYQDRGG
jgi:hypothetical protein